MSQPGGGQERWIEEAMSAVSRFIREIQEPLKKMTESLMEPLKGEKLARDVAAFYKTLIGEGVPEEDAMEMTHEYLRGRIELVESLVSRLLTPKTVILPKTGKECPPKAVMEELEEGKG
ncbi:MAG: hypothetical protein F7C35_03640 [Desulfurococcales archaeon]|nr:hypothetical protein [Desulfurococcales archaeon]